MSRVRIETPVTLLRMESGNDREHVTIQIAVPQEGVFSGSNSAITIHVDRSFSAALAEVIGRPGGLTLAIEQAE